MNTGKIVVSIIAAMIFLNVVSAVSISPSTLTISQQIETSKNYSITITNDKDFTISNFSFSDIEDYGFHFPNIEIEPNSNQTISFEVESDTTANKLIESNVEFRYEADIPTEITTYEIEITEDGFSENFILLRSGDSITWTNKDSIVHRVDFDDFSETIQPNQSKTHTFNDLGTFNYKDETWQAFSGFNAQIEVIERSSTELVHNPNFDLTWNLDLKISDKPTDLEVELEETEFEVSALGETEGLIKIKNIGSETASDIEITSNSNWISPKENNFDLSENSQKFVAFKISPIIFETIDTNKTYTINISIKALNTEKVTKKIEVFIPHNDDFDDPESSTGIAAAVQKAIDKYIEYCQENPGECGGGQGGNRTTEQGNYTFNASAVDIEKLLREQGTTSTELASLRENYGLIEDIIRTTLQQIAEDANQTKENSEEANSKANSAMGITLTFFFFAIVSGWSVFLIILNSKKNEGKGRIRKFKNKYEGQF